MRSFLPFSVVLLVLGLAALPLLADEPAEPEAPKAPDAPKAPSTARIDRLIAQLGASDFETRERASRELLEIGEPARAALEKTMKESENMEARWRAEQILKRLDREGEKPVGRPGESEPALPRPPEGLQPPTGRGDLERWIEELLRRGPRLGSPFGKPRVLEAPGLKLEVDAFGSFATVRLFVTGRMGYFFGRTLEDVLRMHPELSSLEGMPLLKEKWETFKKDNPRLFPFENFPFGGGFTSVITQDNVSIVQTPKGVKVTIRDTDENGKVVEHTYEGESLDEIRRKHPEIADRIRIRSSFGTLVLPPSGRRGPKLPVPPAPVTPPAQTPVPPPAHAAFGVGLAEVPDLLALHLQIEPGHGALVKRVEPGTLAASIGIERHDIIVAIDGKPVTSYAQALDTLRLAGARRTPVTLQVIRRGQRITLPK